MLMPNTISNTAIIHPEAIIGDNNVFGPFCIVHKNVEIGDNNVFYSHVSIGSPAEHKAATSVDEGVVIGSNNSFREFTTINQGTKNPTIIGSNGYFMRGVHFGHDCVIEDFVTIACNAIIGGHTVIMKHANIGLGAMIHQNQIIAPGAMIGMGAVVIKKSIIEPWKTYGGNPASYLGENTVGKQRVGFSKAELHDCEVVWIQEMVKRRMPS